MAERFLGVPMRIVLLVALALVALACSPQQPASRAVTIPNEGIASSAPAPERPTSQAPVPALRELGVRMFFCFRSASGCEPTGTVVFPAGVSCELEEPPTSEELSAEQLAACEREARANGPRKDPPGVSLACSIRARCMAQ